VSDESIMGTAAANHAPNKTAIIVGASRGLGLGLAREFARRAAYDRAGAVYRRSIISLMRSRLSLGDKA
jgi:hypothetical protein